MLRLFDNNHTECCICHTPLSGVNLLRRGDLFYCEADFQRTSPEELIANANTERNYRFITGFVKSASKGEDV